MGIWLNELVSEAKREVRAALRDRRMLRLAMEDRHAAAHEGAGPDCALLLFEACVQGPQPMPQEQAEDLLHAEVARQIYPGFRLRGGQAALLVPGPVDADRVKRLLTSMHRHVQRAAENKMVMAFGVARALEARGVPSWLALADLRLRARVEKHQLQPGEAPAPAVGERRRRTRRPATS